MIGLSPIKVLRQKHRLKLQEVARHGAIAIATLSRVENGWFRLSPRLAQQILKGFDALGVNAESAVREHRLAEEAEQSTA